MLSDDPGDQSHSESFSAQIVVEGASSEDALEYYYYNIVGGHFGERNPLFQI